MTIHPADDEAAELLADRLESYCQKRDTSTGAETFDFAAMEQDLAPELRGRLARAIAVEQMLSRLDEEAIGKRPLQLRPVADRDQLGRFEIREVRGVGGFGVVYRAYDPQSRREVALKVPRLESLLSPEARQRFLLEAQAAAKLDHPHIVSIMENGEIDGFPYLVTSYCAGSTLAQWLKDFPSGVPAETVVVLLLPLAEAVAHAHGRGVLHRDIKPSNVLLVPNDEPGPSDTSKLGFQPKLTDFGLAKLSESTGDQTRTGALVGTVRYMAPEQAAGKVREISTASDIYSLGMVLYELLTGRTAFEAETDLAMLTRIQAEEVRSPRQFRSDIPPDLEAICLKCLERDPKNRYQSATQLVDDLRRFRSGEPTIARPLMRSERWWRWAKKRPAVAGLSLFSILCVVFMAAGGSWYSMELSRSLRRANDALAWAKASDEQSQRLLYAADMKLAGEALGRCDTLQVRQLLDRHLPQSEGRDDRTFIWHFLRTMIERRPSAARATVGEIYCQAALGNGEIVAGGSEGTLQFLDSETLEIRRSLATDHGQINAIAVGNKGRLIATAGKDGKVTVWDAATGEVKLSVAACEGEVFGVGFLRKSKILVTAGDDPAIRFWNLPEGKLIHENKGVLSRTEALSVSPDGNTVICAGSQGRYLILDAGKFSIVSSFKSPTIEEFTAASHSPDGERIALTGKCDGVLVLRSDGSHESYVSLSSHQKQSLTWDQSGSILYVADRAGAIFALDVKKYAIRSSNPRVSAQADVLPISLYPDVLGFWQAHQGRIWTLETDPKTSELVSYGADGQMRRWPHDTFRAWKKVPEVTGAGRLQQVHYLPRDRAIEISDLAILVRNGNFGPATSMHRYPTEKLGCLSLSPNRDKAAALRHAAAGDGYELFVYDTEGLAEYTARVFANEAYPISCVFSADGEHLAHQSSDRQSIRLVSLPEFRTIAEQEMTNLVHLSVRTALVHDRPCFLVSDNNDLVALDCRNLDVTERIVAHVSGVSAIEVAPDGSEIYTIGGDGLLKAWDAATLNQRSVFAGEHLGGILHARFA